MHYVKATNLNFKQQGFDQSKYLPTPLAYFKCLNQSRYFSNTLCIVSMLLPQHAKRLIVQHEPVSLQEKGNATSVIHK